MLYPQTRKIGLPSLGPLASIPLQVNPNACWDWWGYHDMTNAYMTQTGSQMAAIRGMLTAVTGAFQPVLPASSAGVVAPEGLIVSDLSDRAAALAWPGGRCPVLPH